MTEVKDIDREAAEALATLICGCANVRQRKADVAAILAYREAAEKAERDRIADMLDAMGRGDTNWPQFLARKIRELK